MFTPEQQDALLEGLSVMERSGRYKAERIVDLRQAILELGENDLDLAQDIASHINEEWDSLIQEGHVTFDDADLEDYDEDDDLEEYYEDEEYDDEEYDDEEYDDEDEGDDAMGQSYDPALLQYEALLQNEVGRASELNGIQERLLVQDLVGRMLSDVPVGSPTYAAARKHLMQADTVEELRDRASSFETLMQDLGGNEWANANWGSGIGFTGLAKDAPVTVFGDGRAPESVPEMIDAMVQDTRELYKIDEVFTGTDSTGRALMQDSHNVVRHPGVTYTHPSDGLKSLLQTMARQYPDLARAYTMILQGRSLDQALPSGGMGSGSFAAAQPYIFEMISMVYPQLFVTRIGGTIPIDRPLAKIFTRKVIGVKHTTGAQNELHDMYYHDPSLADTPGEGNTSSRVRISVTSEDLSVTDRTLSAIWDIPVEQDYRAYHNRDIMSEIVAEAANEIAREINSLCLGLCYTASDSRQIDWGSQLPDSTTYPGWTMRDWQKTLLTAVLRASTEIFKNRYRMASILLCDPETVVALQQTMEMGAFQTARDTWNYANGIALAGSINNLYTVFSVGFWGHSGAASSYVDKTGTILAIARGETFSDAGLIYAPYTYEVMPMLTQPGERTREIGVLSRDATKVVIPEMFSRVNLKAEQGIPWTPGV